jgi:predicted small lipoprotein YifL
MNRKNILWVPIMAFMVGCGQSGALYLPDPLKAEQLEQQAARAATEERATALRAEAVSLRQRHQQVQSLQAELAEQEQSETRLRTEGKIEAADNAQKEVNRLRYRLGQLTLQQQTSR